MLTVKAGSVDPVALAEEGHNEFPPESPPQAAPISPEERARRRKLVRQILAHREALRQKYGPLDMSASDLKHLARGESQT
jgi:hypothetical protein